ncbi:type IA DNA topoisomerase [Weissella cibaria]|uniref:DNA topoisomerase n=1 Tax=Weissella cibaria TaxID=137591 RepID=A0A0D1JE32_9LACO|nr:type IA DNA topoisomerase [Weissella cibaria]KIU19768.1 DNA topoisomerase 3 [Weissella cibaria]MDV8929023.1 DNA topoisomerase III [Weissella cibaria]
MKTVILAEKPSQAGAYVDAMTQSERGDGFYTVTDLVLNGTATITYGFGHLVALADPSAYGEQYAKWDLAQLPLFPDEYQFVVPDDKKKQFNIVKRFLQETDTIIVTTDSDREGENIAWSIMKQTSIDLKAKTLKRLWINSLEKEAILTGFANLRDGWDYYPAFQEAQTRQISDWLVGMNGSPLYTLLLREKGIRGVYSIGRVQTPTLYLVYQRDLAIQNFKPTPYRELKATITTNNGEFTAHLEPNTRFTDSQSLNQFMVEHQVMMGQQIATITDVQRQAKKTASPRLFSLSWLQSAINKQYHASASDVLKAVQTLYEAKLLTYPRTDTPYITEQEFQYLSENLSAYQTLLPAAIQLTPSEPKSRYVNGKKVQEHHAIIVTKTVPTADKLAGFTQLEQQVYELVFKTTMAMFLPDYEYEETVIITQVGQALFKATGRVPIKSGWKALFASDNGQQASEHDEDDTQGNEVLPVVQTGQTVQADVVADQKMTKPPVPYTEGTLITAMKTAGKTVTDESSQEILKETEGIGTEATRANVLETLKNRGYLLVEKNKLRVSTQGATLCQGVALQPLLTSAEMTASWEKALQEIGTEKRTQANFLSQIQRFVQKLVDEVPGQLATNPVFNQQIATHKAAQAEADAASKLGQCPKCHVGQLVDRGKFYGCDNYKAGHCDFSLPKHWSGKSITPTAIKSLLKTGRTNKLSGFISKKTGNKFSAVLTLKDGKLAFDFGK